MSLYWEKHWKLKCNNCHCTTNIVFDRKNARYTNGLHNFLSRAVMHVIKQRWNIEKAIRQYMNGSLEESFFNFNKAGERNMPYRSWHTIIIKIRIESIQIAVIFLVSYSRPSPHAMQKFILKKKTTTMDSTLWILDFEVVTCTLLHL